MVTKNVIIARKDHLVPHHSRTTEFTFPSESGTLVLLKSVQDSKNDAETFLSDM